VDTKAPENVFSFDNSEFQFEGRGSEVSSVVAACGAAPSALGAQAVVSRGIEFDIDGAKNFVEDAMDEAQESDSEEKDNSEEQHGDITKEETTEIVASPDSCP
jgi:hypothetical protein